jgi:hypothetical protein
MGSAEIMEGGDSRLYVTMIHRTEQSHFHLLFAVLRILMGRKLNTSLYSHEFCLLSYNSLSEVRLLHPFSRSMNSLQEVVLFPEGDGQRLNVNNENMVPDFGIIFQQADQLLSQQSPEQQKSQISPSNYLNRCIVIYGRSEQVKIITFPF